MDDEQNSSDSLPDGWISVSEVTKKGCTVEYFKNTETQQTFNTREKLNRYVAYARQANLPQRVDGKQPDEVRCTRCWNTGHTVPECPHSDKIVAAFNDALRGKTKGKACSRCGRKGHKISSCHGPIFKK